MISLTYNDFMSTLRLIAKAEQDKKGFINLQQLPKSGPQVTTPEHRSRLFGYDVVFNALCSDVPVIQWPNNDTCSVQAREAFNTWALEVFGTKAVVYLLNQKTMVMHPKYKKDFEYIGKMFLENSK